MRASRVGVAVLFSLGIAGCGDGLLGAVNEKPVAVAGADLSGVTGVALAFSATGSTDPDGRIVSFSWAFGDGAAADGEAVTHAFATTGRFEVTLTVTDDDGATATDTLLVDVAEANAAPVAQIDGPNEVRAYEAFTLTSANSSDSDGNIASRTWTLPDGTTKTDTALTLTLTELGQVTIALEVTDDDGATSRVEHVVRVREAAPPASSQWNWGLVNQADASDPACGPFQAAPLDITISGSSITIREGGGSGGSTSYTGTLSNRHFTASHAVTGGGTETIDATFAPDYRTFSGTYRIVVSLLGCNRTRNVQGTRQ